MITRRKLLRGAAMLPLVASLPLRWARAAEAGQARLLVVVLRGGMDGLMAVPAWGDPHYARVRGDLAPGAPGTPGGALDLDGLFGLHPELQQLHGAWQRGELLPVHAVATPYRERSHFDAQNVLEHGLARPDRMGDGWLNRALAALQGGAAQDLAMAVGQTVPLLLRGATPVGSWAPEVLPGPGEDTMARLQQLYGDDAFLGPRLGMALDADAMAGSGQTPMARGGRQVRQLARAAGGLLAHDDGPRVAVMDMDGWDSHANQNGKALQLRMLDTAMAEFRAALGAAWSHTVVLMITEFGRTVAVNGTRGTDHGTGAAALLLGGAVNGGRVLSDWPGLAPAQLREGRDLRPTLDLQLLCASLLHDHLRVSQRVLQRDVFSDTSLASMPADLVRG